MPSRMPSRRRRWPCWLLTAALAWPLPTLAWDYTPGAIPGLISLLGFLTVQSQAIDRAIQRFPAQREELIRARTQFDNAFPQALPRTRRLIAGLPLTDDERQLLIERVLDAHQPSVVTATQSEQTAHALAQRVNERALGAQDRVTLQMLLAVVYDDRPGDELASHFTQGVTLTDWPNAHGASLGLHLPFSWERVPPISRAGPIRRAWPSAHGPTRAARACRGSSWWSAPPKANPRPWRTAANRAGCARPCARRWRCPAGRSAGGRSRSAAVPAPGPAISPRRPDRACRA